MTQNPLAVWESEVPEAVMIGLFSEIQHATRTSFLMCKEAFPGYSPLNYIVGQNRFVALQHRLLQFGATNDTLKAKALFHVNGMPYTQLYTSRLQLTTATVDENIDFPQMSFLREAEQTQQIDFLKGEGILVCHLAINVSALNLETPKIARILFPDGHGDYLTPFVDLTKKIAKPVVLPIEKVSDSRRTPSIGDTFSDESGEPGE